jgi:hypothetical protein
MKHFNLKMALLCLLNLGSSYFYLTIDELGPALIFAVFALVFALMSTNTMRTDP